MKLFTPKENTEYTFIFSQSKIYAFVLDYRLPNGRYRFRCRNANGRGSSWFTDMDEKRFSYLHKFNRDKVRFPDKRIDVAPVVKTKEEQAEDAENKLRSQESARQTAKNKEITSQLCSLTQSQKSLAKKYKINVDDVVGAINGSNEVYADNLIGALALKRDVESLAKLFTLNISL